jgi:hypothetical protein
MNTLLVDDMILGKPCFVNATDVPNRPIPQKGFFAFNIWLLKRSRHRTVLVARHPLAAMQTAFQTKPTHNLLETLHLPFCKRLFLLYIDIAFMQQTKLSNVMYTLTGYGVG